MTKAGGKHWQFEARIKGKLFTRALGEWPAVGLDIARKEAHRLRGLAEQGIDPRAGEALEKAAKAQAEAEKERAAKFTFGALMDAYANELERQGKTSHAKIRGIFKLHLTEGAPKLAATPAALVTAEQVADLLDAKGRTGRGAGLHTIPLLPAARETMDSLLALNPGEFPLSVDGGESPVSAKVIADWAKDAAAGVEWLPSDKPVGQFQAKRIRSGVETALASLRVRQETRSYLLSHGVTGVQAASYDGHDYAPQKLEALETLYRFLTETSASVVQTSSSVAV